MSTTTATSLPPGPRMPSAAQALALSLRYRPFLERMRRRYGSMYTIVPFGPRFRLVVLSDPALIKQTFTADPKVLHAGEGSPLAPILGPHSLLSIDEDTHLRQRKLLLPPFKGQRMHAYEGLIEQIAADEIATWPTDTDFATAAPMQRITLRAILRAVFGAKGEQLAELERLMPQWTRLGVRLIPWPQLHRDLGPRSPWGRFVRLRAAIDAQLDVLIEQARRDPELAERADVLALLVQATHEDGSPMADAEIRDQLTTMISAGHETTAHTLSWAVERLRRHPEPLARLVEEADAGGKQLREATIREVQRMRPVITFAGREVRQPFELGGYNLPLRTRIGLAAILTHFDPALFERPDRFEPDRFVGVTPGTYSWIPFGGGIRRCIGASFAHMELDVVLRVLLERVELLPTDAPDEPGRYTGLTYIPGQGGVARVRRRSPRPITQPADRHEEVAA